MAKATKTSKPPQKAGNAGSLAKAAAKATAPVKAKPKPTSKPRKPIVKTTTHGQLVTDPATGKSHFESTDYKDGREIVTRVDLGGSTKPAPKPAAKK